MKVVVDSKATGDLLELIDFLIGRGALSAAEEVTNIVEEHFDALSRHPRIGKHIPERDIWETYIPGTPLVAWYRISKKELQIIHLWHEREDRL